MPLGRSGTAVGGVKTQLLASCYRRAIEFCDSPALASIAFPAISTGIYRFPADRAAKIAVKTASESLPTAPSLVRIILCCFSEESARLHAGVLARLGSPCTD